MSDCRNQNETCSGRERPGTNFSEAVCIHTDKVYDSCRDKDCLEDVRVYLTPSAQETVDNAINVKFTKAEVIWVFSDVESVPFNRGFYSVDLKYFFKITLQVFTGVGRPTEIEGLATFDKKVILFGSEGNARIFESKYKEDAFDPQLWQKTNLPHAIVEVTERKRESAFFLSGTGNIIKREAKELMTIKMQIKIYPPKDNDAFLKTLVRILTGARGK